MIADLLALEDYMGKLQAIWSLDQLIARFGAEQVAQALSNHWLEMRTIPNLSLMGEQTYVFLSDLARQSVYSV